MAVSVPAPCDCVRPVSWYFPFRDGPEEGPAEPGKEKCNRIVASWTAMQHIDKENGCLFVKVRGEERQRDVKSK